MKTLTNTEKIVRWAKAQKTRNLGHVLHELIISETSLKRKLNRMREEGVIDYKIVGRNIVFSA